DGDPHGAGRRPVRLSRTMRGSRMARILAMLIVVRVPVWAQTVTLQIRPRVGDTLRMMLDQRSEMTGVKRTSAGDESAIIMSSMKMFSRAVVEAASDRGTTLLAVTDSVLLSTTDPRARADAVRAQAQMRG